ncbi:hypothetical protein MMPV_007385 [Pyropia vietnamensis]
MARRIKLAAVLTMAMVITTAGTASAATAALGTGVTLEVKVAGLSLYSFHLAGPSELAKAEPYFAEGCLARDGPSQRRVLRFGTTITNVGSKDLVLGVPPHDRQVRTQQWAVCGWEAWGNKRNANTGALDRPL